VAVYVEDAGTGAGPARVVRHLVAGVLGRNPPPPSKPGLAQSIEWDGKDDDGKPAGGGPFKVRVGLQLRARIEEYVLNSPEAIGMAGYLGIDNAGNLYHCCNPGGVYYWNAPGMLMRVYDRQGKYLRTIMPYPANLPIERLNGAGVFQADGRIYPVWHDVTEMRLYPGRETYGHEMFVTSTGRVYKLVSAGGSGVNEWVLRAINTDGSAPADAPMIGAPFAPPMRAPNAGIRNWICAASDEKWAYLSGFSRRGKSGDIYLAIRGRPGRASLPPRRPARSRGCTPPSSSSPRPEGSSGAGPRSCRARAAGVKRFPRKSWACPR